MKTIAEVGVNHNGSPDLAYELIEASRMAGADFVKFQTFRTDSLVTSTARQAQYQRRTLGRDGAQYEMLRKLELGSDVFRGLKRACEASDVAFLSTPFDNSSATFLIKELGCDLVKIGSGDLDNLPLLLHVARAGAGVILSTGMSGLGDVETSLGALAFGYTAPAGARPGRDAFLDAYASAEGGAALRNKVTLLHCTSEYPAPYESLNLRAIATLRAAFGLPVGLSDHSCGSEAAIAATALGATILEKHVTLDTTMVGPDHAASLEPAEFAAMVTMVRNVQAAMGDGLKRIQPAERGNREVSRKRVVAARAIAFGTVLDGDDLTVKRSHEGLPASVLFDLLGTRASRNFAPDEAVS